MMTMMMMMMMMMTNVTVSILHYILAIRMSGRLTNNLGLDIWNENNF